MTKALTLWQPWASLVALGVKTIETRSWSTSYRGPLAIHAAKREADLTTWIGSGAGLVAVQQMRNGRFLHLGEVQWTQNWHPMPLGAVVATCTLVDVVPTNGPLVHSVGSLGQAGTTRRGPYEIRVGGGWAQSRKRQTDEYGSLASLVDPRQIPYGDFSPGRFAWLLADIEPLADPIPAKGQQGLWEWTP